MHPASQGRKKEGPFVQLSPNCTLDLNKDDTAHVIRNYLKENEKQQNGGAANHIISGRVRRNGQMGAPNYWQWNEKEKEIANQRR